MGFLDGLTNFLGPTYGNATVIQARTENLAILDVQFVDFLKTLAAADPRDELPAELLQKFHAWAENKGDIKSSDLRHYLLGKYEQIPTAMFKGGPDVVDRMKFVARAVLQQDEVGAVSVDEVRAAEFAKALQSTNAHQMPSADQIRRVLGSRDPHAR